MNRVTVVWRGGGAKFDLSKLLKHCPTFQGDTWRRGDLWHAGREHGHDGFNRTVADELPAGELAELLREFLSQSRIEIDAARDAGAESVIDIAVYVDASAPNRSLVVGAPLLSLLASAQLSLEVSAYLTS